jgi:hypothetical protein
LAFFAKRGKLLFPKSQAPHQVRGDGVGMVEAKQNNPKICLFSPSRLSDYSRPSGNRPFFGFPTLATS